MRHTACCATSGGRSPTWTCAHPLPKAVHPRRPTRPCNAATHRWRADEHVLCKVWTCEYEQHVPVPLAVECLHSTTAESLYHQHKRHGYPQRHGTTAGGIPVRGSFTISDTILDTGSRSDAPYCFAAVHISVDKFTGMSGMCIIPLTVCLCLAGPPSHTQVRRKCPYLLLAHKCTNGGVRKPNHLETCTIFCRS